MAGTAARNGSITAIQWGGSGGSGWLYEAGSIKGSYHYGYVGGSGSWLVAV